MILKTHGVALRIEPFSKTSMTVRWLTPDKGRLTTLIKGAQRPRSVFLGQCDLFRSCELLYYEGRHSSLHILKECCAVDFREHLREDWKSAACASYLCDLLNRLSPEGVPHPEVYEFAGQTLDFLSSKGCSPTVVHWAETRLLRLLGLAPRLDACAACGRLLAKASASVGFSVPRGGLVCRECQPTPAHGVLFMPEDVLAMIRTWQETSSPTIALRTACTADQRIALGRLLGMFLDYHLESSRARTIALEML